MALRDLHRRRGCFTFFRCLSALRDQIAANDVRCPMYKLGVSRIYAIYIATADVHGSSSMFCGVSRLYAIYIAAVDVSWVDVQIDDARLYAICIAADALQCTMFEFHENSRLVAISNKNTSVSYIVHSSGSRAHVLAGFQKSSYEAEGIHM